MSGANPQAFVKPLAQTRAFRLFGNGHDYLLSTLGTVSPLSRLHAKIRAQSTPPLLLDKELKTNTGWVGCICVLSSLGDGKGMQKDLGCSELALLFRLLPSCNFGKMFPGDEKLANEEEEEEEGGFWSFIMAS